MMLRLVLSLALVAGCGGGSPPPAAPPPPPAAPAPPPPSTADRLAAFADEMCACKDEACAKAVQARVSAFSRTAAATVVSSPADQKRFEQSGERYGACMAPLIANSHVELGADGLPTTCKEYADAVKLLLDCPLLKQQTKDALAESFRQMREAFATVPPERMPQLAVACSTAADAIRGKIECQ
jgi:hypothetical protein